MSRDVKLLRVSLGILLVASAVSCAAATATPKLRRADSPRGVVARLADLHLELGTECVVTLVDGSLLRGRLASLSADTLGVSADSRAQTTSPRVVREADLVSVGRIVGASKPMRAWRGAGIGALISLPLSVSMLGDMMVPAALLGSLIGRIAGDERIEVLFQRAANNAQPR